MSDNIYNIDTWQPSTFYYKNKIVQNGNYYYYALIDHTSTSNFLNDLNAGDWGGTIYDRGETKPYFIWKPSYDFENDNKPRIKTIQFGDGYSQDIRDGINNLLLNYNFNFNNRDLREATAILHFLTTRSGSESFLFLCPMPRGVNFRFKVKQWTDKQNFFNNYSITAAFTQVPI